MAIRIDIPNSETYLSFLKPKKSYRPLYILYLEEEKNNFKHEMLLVFKYLLFHARRKKTLHWLSDWCEICHNCIESHIFGRKGKKGEIDELMNTANTIIHIKFMQLYKQIIT